MPTVCDLPYTCAVCGRKTKFPTIMDIAIVGNEDDLDFRPSGIRGTIISTWVQTCPHCGYASDTIERPTSVTEEWLASAEYASLADVTDGIEEASLPALAKEFLMSSKCYLADGSLVAASANLLYAAWVCDDEGATAFARRFRILAANLLGQEIDAIEEAGEQGGTQAMAEVAECDADEVQSVLIALRLRLVDYLRRAGELDRATEALSQAERALATDSDIHLYTVIAAYERDLIDEGDTGCHMLDEAVDAHWDMPDPWETPDPEA